MPNMKNLLLTAALVLGVFVSCQQAGQESIDRKALVDGTSTGERFRFPGLFIVG